MPLCYPQIPIILREKDCYEQQIHRGFIASFDTYCDTTYTQESTAFGLIREYNILIVNTPSITSRL